MDIKEILEIADKAYCNGEGRLTKPHTPELMGAMGGDTLATFIRNELIEGTLGEEDPLARAIKLMATAIDEMEEVSNALLDAMLKSELARTK